MRHVACSAAPAGSVVRRFVLASTNALLVFALFGALVSGGCSSSSSIDVVPEIEWPEVRDVDKDPTEFELDLSTTPDHETDGEVSEIETYVPEPELLPCNSNGDCDEEFPFCIPTKDGGRCTMPCVDSCWAGWKCAWIIQGPDGYTMCVPQHITLCRPCDPAHPIDCTYAQSSSQESAQGVVQDGAVCHTFSEEEGSFCLTYCSDAIRCPVGYECVPLPNDTPDPGDRPDAPPTLKYCQPEDNVCTCDDVAAANRMQTPCSRTEDLNNAGGSSNATPKWRTCSGVRTCSPDDPKGLSECDAKIPVTETCNGEDDDCNGTVDDSSDLEAGGPCTIEDAFGACAIGQVECKGGLECVPEAKEIPEVCNGIDDDCDGDTDEDNAVGCKTYYKDADQDGFGASNDAMGRCLCKQEPPYTATGTYAQSDCGDQDPKINPNAVELCDGIDNNCSGGPLDEAFPEKNVPCKVCTADNMLKFTDMDKYCNGVCNNGVMSCGVVADGSKQAYCKPQYTPDPELTTEDMNMGYVHNKESCNGLDDDCDGSTDEADVDASGLPEDIGGINALVYYIDKDNDGYGDKYGDSRHLCKPQGKYTSPNKFDCDDSSAEIRLSAEEICDGIDNDCDGKTDAPSGYSNNFVNPNSLIKCTVYYLDNDGDGFASYSALGYGTECRCADVAADDMFTAEETGDCDDTVGSVHPNHADWNCDDPILAMHSPRCAEEKCDGIDSNCNGMADEADVKAPCVGAQYCDAPPKQRACIKGSSGDWELQECADIASTKQDCKNYSDCNAPPVNVCVHACPKAPAEVCNGKDDDGDCLVDKDDVTRPDPDDPSLMHQGMVLAACENVEGVCEFAVHDVSKCVNGKWDSCDSTDYSQVPGYEAVEASCDNLDNDCDGQTDEMATGEGVVGSPCFVFGKKGECAKGQYQCDKATSTTVCTQVNESVTEECDGMDNDCDDVKDNLPPRSCQVYNEFGTCAGKSWCYEGTWTDCDAPEPARDRCNGLDDDCNGVTDDGEPDLGLNCDIVDPKLVSGLKGICGTDGIWTQCLDKQIYCGQKYAKNQVKEACNGVDDDCDGETDADDPGDLVTNDKQYCENQNGVCSGATKTADLCVDGHWLKCTDADYTAYNADYQPTVELTCDLKDNNCNGVTDDNTVDTKVPCYPQQIPGTPYPGKRLLGICGEEKYGTMVCESGGLYCHGQLQPGDVAEVCDGLDNDCDGQVDEGLGATTCGLGQCNHTIFNCVSGVPQICNAKEGWSAEVCDGVDNDCNGAIDDGFPCQRATTTSCGNCGTMTCSSTTCTWGNCTGEGVCNPDAPLSCGTDTGECVSGTKKCTSSCTWPNTCPGSVSPVTESCDNLDDDCDGSVDEGSTCYATSVYWDPAYFSEEGAGYGSCGPIDSGDEAVVGLRCSGQWCDNVSLRCGHAPFSITGAHKETDTFSEEGVNWRIIPAGNVVTGLRCYNHECDNIRLIYRSTSVPLTDSCYWTTTSVSDEDGASGLPAPAGYYLTGVRCEGSNCDNKYLYFCKP